jgi:glycerate dehydrogenase
MELAGKTIGIIGFGRIGRAVGKIAKAFGMHVLAFNRSRCEEGEQIGRYVDLDTLLKESDVISLHCPLFPETEKLINSETIAKMKDGAILLNTSRGQVIDEVAVSDALRSGKLRGAAMDVVSEEPISPTNPLLTASNCIITPHMAWAPVETRQRILDTTVQSIRGFLNNSPVNVVNP